MSGEFLLANSGPPLPLPLVLFDGVCNLCGGMTRFVLAREKSSALSFSAVQSATGQALLKELGLPTTSYETVVVIEAGEVFVKSDAVLHLATYLKPPWPLLAKIAALCPIRMRDWVYDRIARNRYRLLGRKESCLVPTADIAHRFVN